MPRLGIFLWLMLCAAFLPTTGSAQQYLDYSRYTRWVGEALTVGDDVTSVTGTSILGTDYLVTTSAAAGVSFFLVQQDGLQAVGSLDLPGGESGVAFDGGTTYVVSRPDRVAKVVAYNPAALQGTWSVALPGEPEDVAFHGGYLLIACGTGGLLVFDPTEQFGPNPVGVVGSWSGQAWQIELVADRALVRTDTGLVALDLTVPTAPSTVATFTAPAAATTLGGLTVAGDRAYLGLRNHVYELDLAASADLALVRDLTVTTGSYLVGLAADQEGLFLALGYDLTMHLDLDTGLVDWVGQYYSGTRGVGVHGPWVGWAAGARGFICFARETPAFSPVVRNWDVPHSWRSCGLSAGFLLAFSDQGISCFALGGADPDLAWTIGLEQGWGYVKDLFHREGRAYVLTYDRWLRILDYDAAGWNLVGAWQVPADSVESLVVLGDRLVALVDRPGTYGFQAELWTYAVGDPGSVVLTAEFAPGTSDRKLRLAGDTLVLAGNVNGILHARLYDARDPDALRPAQAVPIPDTNFTLDAGHLYTVDDARLKVWDITDPDQPVDGPWIPLPQQGRRLVSDGTWGYLEGGNLVYDLGDALTPRVIGAWSQVGSHYLDIWAAAPGYLLLGDNTTFLRLAPGQGGALVAVGQPTLPPVSDRGLRAVPNPFNPRVRLDFTLPLPGQAELDIFDVKGRRVARLGGRFVAGPQTVVWEGREDGGRDLPSGVYLARVRSGSWTQTRKIVLAR